MYSSLEEHSFGYWLRLRRKALDLTQDGLADRVGCSAALIRKIESEERRPSAQIIERLAEIFNIPAGEQSAFLRFARGDWKSTPESGEEIAPWMSPEVRQSEFTGSRLQLATFLFTDIEGSAKLWENAPDRMKVALQRHHQILQEAITSTAGTVFQIIGDAFCAAFPTVLSAVSAAVNAQQELHREQWDLPFPIRARIGIHTGEAERTSNDNYASGPTLNRVARILSAAHGGQILLSLATKDLVKDSLPANTELRDMGEHYLKNLMYPEHLFQLNIADLPSEFPPLNTLTHRHNLPVQVTSFIARESEIALVHEYLSKDDIRLVTLIGPPGIGKTRLSIEAARASLHDFADGVFFVALALLPMGDPNSIPSGISQALGFLETGNSAPEDQLKENIGQKQILIVLDNCEHLIEGMASIASRLLSACPHLKLLATSRESLRIPGEWLYPIPAFDIPKESDVIGLDTASTFPALMLFLERARAVRPDFKLTSDNVQTIAAICAHLDGLPLVIELMAARMRLMSPQALLDRLTGQFVLTADGMRAASERQKTLRNAIDWSYSLLSEQEQKLFVYLSVFSGSFTLAEAEAIFAHTVSEKSVPELLTLLLDKSLIRRVANESREDRYEMLMTIQEYALERLRGSGEEIEIRNRHLAYFCELAEQARPGLRGAGQLAWLDCLDAEYDNLRAVLHWAQESRAIAEGLRLITALEWFWAWRVHLQEPILALENLLAGPLPADQNLVLTGAHRVAGHLQSTAGNKISADAHFKERERLCLLLGPEGKVEKARLLNFILHESLSKEPNQIHRNFDEVLKLLQETGDQWEMALLLRGVGLELARGGDSIGAHQALEQSRILFRECGDSIGAYSSDGALMLFALEEGKYAEARAQLEEILHFYRQARLDYFIDAPLWMLGVIAVREKDYARAKERYTECLLFDQQIGLTKQLAECLIGFAGIASAESRFERAAQLLVVGEAEVEASGTALENIDRIEVHRLTALLRQELGDARFEALASQGRLMTRKQAIAYALENQK